MAIGASLRSQIARYVPTWLANVPQFRRLFSIAWAVAIVGDELRQIALEGQYAAYPGVGTPTANPLLAQSRGLLQGPSESDALFVLRLLAFRGDVKEMGSPEGRVKQIQAFLVGQGSLGAGVYPVVRTIDRAGITTTIDASGNVTFGSVAWDWDDLGGWVDASGYHAPAEVEGYWSDVWVLIEDPYTHYTSFSDLNWLAAWNSGDQTIDALCPQGVVQGIQQIAETWKGAHIYVRQIVFCPDPTTFTPDGHYGNWSKKVAGVQVPARTVANGYWTLEAAG